MPTMRYGRITRVVPIAGAVDRLLWDVEFSPSFWGTFGTRILLDWTGDLVFDKRPIPANSMPPPGSPNWRLAGRWVNRERLTHVHPQQTYSIQIESDLPGDALDRLERFRDSGRLYVRVEAEVTVLLGGILEPGVAPDAIKSEYGFLLQLRNPSRSMRETFRTEAFELTRDVWGYEILGALRPPGRFIFEATIPFGTAHEEVAKKGLAHLTESRKALDEGRYAEVARLCYRAIEELAKLSERIETQYGKYGKDRLLIQMKEVRSLCDPERHGSKPVSEDCVFDRPLAEHVLSSVMSFASVVLRS
jgi:hypothetical protein